MSGSHAYGGDCPGMAGRYHYGGGGLGVLGAALAVDGYIYPSLTPPDAAKEYYGLITAIPAGLTISVGEPGDFDASANDGTYVVPWDLYEWGAKIEPSTSFSLKYGNVATVNLAISNLASAGTLSTGVAGVVPSVAGVRNLAIANLASAGTLSTVAIAVSPNSGVLKATYILETFESRGSIPWANLNGLRWHFFDQVYPVPLSAPVAQGTVESTDGSGSCLFDIAGQTALTPGQVGTLAVSNTNGDPEQAGLMAFFGPVVAR